MKIFCALFLLPFIASSQVMNIEEERISTDSTGWAGEADVTFQLMKSNDKLVEFESNLHLQYKTKKSLYLFLSNYSLVNASDQDFANSGYQHIRYNYKLADWYTLEAFTQAQFNKILNMKFRGLLGAGPRFKILKAKKFRLYAAWLYMFEYEELDTGGEIDRNHRISSYASFTLKVNDMMSLINTTYFQPLIDNFNDFRISAQTDLKIKISKKFAFSVGYNHYYDSDPPENVEGSIYSIENKISFGF